MIGQVRNMSFYSYNPSLVKSMRRLSSMQRINRASDDASGLAISEKLITQTRGNDRAARNVREMQDLTNIAEGALNSVTDNLQRMRTLTLQAGNGLYTKEDREAIQMEIDHLKGQINETVKTTEYNKMPLLDGSFKDKFAMSSANGNGTKISIPALDTKSLGIDSIDVTNDTSLKDALSTIDNAQMTVLKTRSDIGAKFNRLGSTFNNLNVASENMRASNARIRGLDYAGISNAINNLNFSKITNSYKAYMMKSQMNLAGNFISYMM